METLIAEATTDDAIRRCYPVLVQLRPHIHESEFLLRVRRQQADGYRLAFLDSAAEVRAVAGYRFLENLAWGRFCYVDDLVTASGSRSQAFGRSLFEWLITQAREAGCQQFHLDSGVQRFDAHRFYLARRMAISSHHFSLDLQPRAADSQPRSERPPPPRGEREEQFISSEVFSKDLET